MQIERTTPERLARGLGWFSIGLGAAELIAPKRLARFIGVPDDGSRRTLLRALGARELMSGIGILAERRPTGWLYGRVGGDLIDLALLGWALASPRSQRARVAGALGAVLAVGLLDALTGEKLRRQRPRRRLAVTINRSLDEVRAGLAPQLLDELGPIELRAAAGGRGTESHIERHGMRAKQTLAHLKQRLETGEVLHSDASIHRLMHPARPSKERP